MQKKKTDTPSAPCSNCTTKIALQILFFYDQNEEILEIMSSVIKYSEKSISGCNEIF